ncbi:unnamed protein product [Mytilus coruscus]|uniref:RING-type domain-containing protein n=1 Tax=Mytilus coruscus TaxID=42192 RepID=A0A6J8A8A6_MYTCO|nr:unnamed protein product [Mytilus coruscus]
MLQRGYKNYTFLPPDDSLFHKRDTKDPIKDPMQYEGTRISTFATFPETNGVYATRLARAGFYYTGNSDEVVCFNCHISYKNWKQHDSPEEVHKRLSPYCDFIQNTSSKFKAHAVTGPNVSSGAFGSPRNATELNKILSSKNDIPVKNNDTVQCLNMPNTDPGRMQSYHCETNQNLNKTTDNISNIYITRTEAHQIPNNYSTNDANSLIRISQSNVSYINYNTRESNSQSLSQITTNDTTIASKAPLEPNTMGICIDNPKYPKYAIKISRLDSFKHWPTYLTQSPDEMVLAGFFFTGNEDHCRCFFCGGGLRNWEPGDQPWVEHARWYQNCAFVRNCKGDRFVQDVQTNNYVLTEIVENKELPNTKRPVDDFRSIPAVRSVSEFGYDEKLIKKAYNTLKKAGTSDITSTVLLEAIFNLEENYKQSHDNSNHNKQTMESSQSRPVITKEVNNETTSNPEPELSVRSLEEENQNLRDQQTCKICLDEPIAIVFLPCGHLAACVTCAPALRRCPICRTFIKGTVKAIMC